MANDQILIRILDNGGYNGIDILKKANTPDAKRRLRELTQEAKELGLCGAPSYRVLRRLGDGQWDQVGDLVWGQDELNVVEDLITGWTINDVEHIATPIRVATARQEKAARL